MPETAPQRDAIVAALERLLVWSEIARSPQLARFLDYIVRRTLDGDEQAIKAYSIAVDVFGRGSDFDPQADPIVRVQARRLRGLLEQYYAGTGQDETVVIRLPVGRYVPEFARRQAVAGFQPPAPSPPEPVPPAREEPPKGSVTMSWLALLVLAIGIAVTAYALSTWGSRQANVAASAGAVQPPSVTVVEFQNLAMEGAGAPMVAGLAIELVTDLRQFEFLDVAYGGVINGALAEGPATDYMLSGIVRPDGTLVQYSAILTDRRTSDIVWNFTVPVSASQARNADVLDMVSRSLSLVLGSTRGPLHVNARSFLATTPPLGGQVNLYLCAVVFDIYRETGSPDDAERANACIGALPEAEQQAPVALAMQGSLIVDYASPGVTSLSAAVDRQRVSEANITRAIAEAPTSGFIWEQMARLHEAMGRPERARADFNSSLQLNPANGDALAAYARLLTFAGAIGEAERPARDALDGVPNPPPWYHGVPALLALRAGDFDMAIQHAAIYAVADRELGPVLAIMAGHAAGDSNVVNRYLPQVLEVPAFRSRGVLTRLRERISDDALMESIRAALVEAGVPPGTLVRSF